MVAVGQAFVLEPSRDVHRPPGEPQRARIEKHVAGVGEQGQRVGQETARDFHEHEPGDENEGAPKQSLVIGDVIVRVSQAGRRQISFCRL